MKIIRVAGTTSQTVDVLILDSTSTVGAGLTGLAFGSGGLVAYYSRTRSASVAIPLVTQTVTGAYSSGGFVQIDSTNMPGLYRLDIPDAALAAGADSVVIILRGATNMVDCRLEIDLGSTISSATILDSVVVETGLNARQALSIIAAAIAGASTGVDTGSPIFKGAGVATTRITGTSSSGNRSAITLTPPA